MRAVLAHHGLPWRGHELSIFKGDTYLPSYVRLRLAGCARHGGPLVSRHSGSTSIEAGGCDGAVVPTLVDHASGDIIVDSKCICIHLDAQVREGGRLRPTDLAAAVDRELAVVDDLPNYQMLMGRPVSEGEAPLTRSGVGETLSMRKVAWCDERLQECGPDEALAGAYRAKRAKELSAARELFSPEAMRAAYSRAEAAVVRLDAQLAARSTQWLLGDEVTMADLFWGIELLRMANVGVASFWEGGTLPNVEEFVAAAARMPAISEAVLEWPGATF